VDSPVLSRYRAVMQTPGTAPIPELRARSAGEIIDAAMKLYFARWKTFIPVAAIFMIPYAAASAIFGTYAQADLEDNPAFTDPDVVPTFSDLAPIFVPAMVIGLVALLLYPVVAAAISWAAARIYMGEDPSVGQIISFAFSKLGSLILVSILTGLAVMGGFILLIIPGLIFLVRFMLAPTVVVVENGRGREAMKRSWNLVKGFFWKVVGITLLAGIITAIVEAVASLPFTFAASYFMANDNLVPAALLAFIGSAISGALLTPFGVIVQVLLYFDLRIRKEGLDLSLMAQQIGQ
jgi:hypothetical protein